MKEVTYTKEPQVDRYVRITLKEGEYCLFSERGGRPPKVAIGPGSVAYTKTKSGYINGVAYYKMRIVSLSELQKLL